MPTETPVYDEHAQGTVVLRGDVDVTLALVIEESDGTPMDLTDKTLVLMVTNADGGLEDIAAAVTIVTAADGSVSVLFGEAVRAVVVEDDGVYTWILAEDDGGTRIPRREGQIFRTALVQG